MDNAEQALEIVENTLTDTTTMSLARKYGEAYKEWRLQQFQSKEEQSLVSIFEDKLTTLEFNSELFPKLESLNYWKGEVDFFVKKIEQRWNLTDAYSKNKRATKLHERYRNARKGSKVMPWEFTGIAFGILGALSVSQSYDLSRNTVLAVLGMAAISVFTGILSVKRIRNCKEETERVRERIRMLLTE